MRGSSKSEGGSDVVRTCVITGYGINADRELAMAFQMAGSQPVRIHVHDIVEQPAVLDAFHILAFPGGFSFGDHLGSGKVLAGLFKRKLKGSLEQFVESGKIVIGICNGFQVLVKMGVLPNLQRNWRQEVSLIHNDSGTFEDRWVTVEYNLHSPCIWTRSCSRMALPVRHGEGKFVVGSESIYEALEENQLVALRYVASDNSNGSFANIAGICDPTGRILGLMPHPEAYVIPETHPSWYRGGVTAGEGLVLFKNGVQYVHAHLAGT